MTAEFVPSAAFVVSFPRATIDHMAQPFRLAHVRRDAPANLQRRHGHEQERRPGRARLADDVRLQHVSVSRFQMGRWNFV